MFANRNSVIRTEPAWACDTQKPHHTPQPPCPPSPDTKQPIFGCRCQSCNFCLYMNQYSTIQCTCTCNVYHCYVFGRQPIANKYVNTKSNKSAETAYTQSCCVRYGARMEHTIMNAYQPRKAHTRINQCWRAKIQKKKRFFFHSAGESHNVHIQWIYLSIKSNQKKKKEKPAYTYAKTF